MPPTLPPPLPATRPRDLHGRPLGSLRLSVTDRCNLRCHYCMPEADYPWLPRAEILDFEELTRVAAAHAALGCRRVRITGGEPLMRRGLPILIAELAAVEGIDDIALTTNGLLLADRVDALRDAGLRRVTVSLDTLDPARFEQLTRRDALDRVLAGLDAAAAAGFDELKIDCVVLRGENDDELVALLDHGAARGAEVRFIEYMDVGGATHWSDDQVVDRGTILDRVGRERGRPVALPGRGSAPAERFQLPDGRVFGIIASTTAPFCGACDRARVTASGRWLSCLYAAAGVELRPWLRGGMDHQELTARIGALWSGRDSRGAEQRAALPDRAPLVPLDRLRRDPNLEMHTRGG